MKRVFFLHIPKTAGQSAHHLVCNYFPEDAICPARLNHQLNEYSFNQLSKYKLFSGHLDWSKLDWMSGKKFAFTILRDPMERLLSYYFYLREQAEIFKQQNQLEGRPGLEAVITQTPDQYFLDKENPLRNFIDKHYDNFYTNYFSDKSYDGLLNANMENKSYQERLSQAVINLDEVKTYWIEDWQTRLNNDLSSFLKKPAINLKEDVRVNVGQSNTNSRVDKLKALGASDQLLRRLESYCEYDLELIHQLRIK